MNYLIFFNHIYFFKCFQICVTKNNLKKKNDKKTWPETTLILMFSLSNTEQNNKLNTFVFAFIWHFLQTNFQSNIVQKCVYICDSEHFFLAKLIYTPSQVCHIKVLIRQQTTAQVCLRLTTIKDHSKICCVVLLGWWGGNSSKCHQSNAPVFMYITYSCPYHNPTTTTGHLMHRINSINPNGTL